ncbi:hypothetical protein [Ferrovibrio sp.]|uniref:hypothetical protein n=1 Tax=Ferrovibrio sp. TaxID=1917215 RepID=UPI0025BA6F29|nr:hypothetical protein [Ferrovibrio sp.]MBX3456280.1 hypothetical protein [Ferrovibrio sp.]
MRSASFSIFILAGLLAGCSSASEDMALRGQKELVGASERQILACIGEPTARHREGNNDLLVYFRETSSSAPMSLGTGSIDSDKSPLSRSPAPYDYFRYCEATFAVRQGRVIDVAMTGRTATGRSTLSACGPIVAKCLK